MKVSIITERFSATGSGHLTRCISVYQAFLARNILPTLYVHGDKASLSLLEGLNFMIVDWISCPEELILKIKQGDVLIIDSYLANAELYDRLHIHARLPVYIDDNIRIEYPAGTIINGTINSETFAYKRKPDQTYLLGSRYIPLRPEFRKVPHRNSPGELQSILITFGGQDPKNLTRPVLELTEREFPDIKKRVIIGAGFENPGQFNQFQGGNVSLYHNPSPAVIRDLMVESDVAISAAGQTLYELAACGTPTIAIAVVDNQMNNILEWVKKSFISSPIFSEEPDYLEKIKKALIELAPPMVRENMSKTGQTNVDGAGADRIAGTICNQITPLGRLTVRKIGEEDIPDLFQLANDTFVRSNSINTGQITWEDHLAWCRRKLTDQQCLLMVFHLEGVFAGQVRFDLSRDEATVSISIHESFRGKGLAKNMLCLAAGELFRNHPMRVINAFIRPQNSASVRSFISSGYKPAGERTINSEPFLLYKLEYEQYKF